MSKRTFPKPVEKKRSVKTKPKPNTGPVSKPKPKSNPVSRPKLKSNRKTYSKPKVKERSKEKSQKIQKTKKADPIFVSFLIRRSAVLKPL